MDPGGLLQIHRKPESEGAAFAKFARDLQRCAVFIGDGFADRKSEASTSGSTSSRFVGAVKAVKNLRQMLFGDAAAGIVDDEEGIGGVRNSGQFDATTIRCVI